MSFKPTKKKNNYILIATCEAGTGVVAAVSSYLANRDCYICALEQFDDESTNKFFMRAVFRTQDNSPPIDKIKEGFSEVAEKLDMKWQFHNPQEPTRVIIMVSKFDHCLNDLIYRSKTGDLHMEIIAIVSNHTDLEHLAEREGIKFVYISVNDNNKIEQEETLLKLIEETDTDLVVLARYMQILSDNFSNKLIGRCINIHHSFLPGFKGAKPYHQAYDRGVKVIGATAHYVTSELDEGPIIEQIVTRVDHNHMPDHLAQVGRDNENIALAKAVKYHIERRVFLDGKKTVVFLGS